jgi:uncharacterized protein (DUF2345 family)
MMDSNGFIGYDRFVWFQGVVEDRMDPLKLGRLRVRILGLHTEDKTKIPTEELPWAFPIMPISSASMNGIGEAPVGPVEGTWVIGFFRDGESCQEPVVFGTIGGIPQEKTRSNIGFSDPKGHYPEDEFIGEADTNRLARAEKIDETVIQVRKKTLANINGNPIKVALEEISENGSPRPTGQDTAWLEPNPPYKAKYPFNKVFQTEGGIIKEWDDTKDHRRIHEYHPCGTFYEVYEEEGKAHKITKINGINYTIILDDDNIFVRGSVNITAEGRVNIYSGNDINVEANNKLTIHAKKDTSIFCTENISLTATKDINISSGGNMTFNCAGSMNTTVGQNYTTTTELGSISLVSNQSMGLSSILNMNIFSLANCYLYGLVESNISSGFQTTIDSSINTTVQSDVSTAVGSKVKTKVTAGGGDLTLQSLTNMISLESPVWINLEAPVVSRKIPITQPIGLLTFNE